MRPFARFLNWSFKNRKSAMAVACSLSAVGFYLGANVPVRLGLLDLLPENHPDVVDFRSVSREVGGVGFLAVIVGPTNDPEQYLLKLGRRLGAQPGVKDVFFERPDWSLRDKALYLMPSRLFESVSSDAEVLLKRGKTGGIFDLVLEDDNGAAARRVSQAKKDFQTLKEEYLPNQKSDERFQRYFLARDGRTALLWLKPDFDSEDVGRSQSLVTMVDAETRMELGPDVPFKLWGRSVNHVRDTQVVKSDIASTGVAGLFLVGLALVLGLGSFRAAAIVLSGVTLALGMTLGFTHQFVGQVNLVTGFLLAILGGLGVEYGIHFIRRYRTERSQGLDHEAALKETYYSLSRVLLSAALTSSGAFLLLAWSDFRGFSELGRVAGFGIIVVYLTFLLVFPFLAGFLGTTERFPKFPYLLRFYPWRARAASFAIGFLILGLAGLGSARFEEDFEKVRELSRATQEVNRLVHEINNQRSTTPAALLAPDTETAERVRAWLEAKRTEQNLQAILTLRSFVPADMTLRDHRLASLRETLRRLPVADIEREAGISASLIRSWVEARPYGLEAVPSHLRRAFGEQGRVVLVYTKENLSTARGIERFASLFDQVRAEFPGVKIGTDVGVIRSILHHIRRDGAWVLVLFFMGALGVLWADFRSVRESAILVLQLALGLLLAVGFMGWLGVPFTIFNVAMVPAVLASGIDMGVHVRHRELESGRSATLAARDLAAPIHLGVFTSLAGFGVLLLAEAPMLRSIGWVSVAGTLSMYFVCMVLWPTMRDAIYSRRQSRSSR